MQNIVFWIGTMRKLVGGYRRFGGVFCIQRIKFLSFEDGGFICLRNIGITVRTITVLKISKAIYCKTILIKNLESCEEETERNVDVGK
jgi:hypothetical protein